MCSSNRRIRIFTEGAGAAWAWMMPKRLSDRKVEQRSALDPKRQIRARHRTVDTVRRMVGAGSITPEMHDAARAFQDDFVASNLDPLRAVSMLRVPGTRREPELTDHQIDACCRVHEALQALDGLSSPAAGRSEHATARSIPSEG